MQPLTATGGETGIGLQNTSDRLQRLYGATQKLEILGAEPRGTEIRISIPFKDYRTVTQSQATISDE